MDADNVNKESQDTDDWAEWHESIRVTFDAKHKHGFLAGSESTMPIADVTAF